MVDTPRNLQKGAAALATVLPADQPVRPLYGDDDGEPDPTNTTTILHGAKAFIGKASWSVGAQGANAATFAQYEEAKKKEAERLAAEARERARLAEWGAQRTVIGGVEMTNADAQSARQHLIDHGDRYADWAVQQGHISADQKDEFKEGMRRKTELEDKHGRGILTAAEEREADALNASQLGRALDVTTAQAHRDRGIENAATMQRGSLSNEALRRPGASAATDTAVFQAYDTATAAAMPSPPVTPKLKASGLDL